MKMVVLSFHEATHQFVAEILNAGFDGFWSKFNNRDGFVKKLNVLFP